MFQRAILKIEKVKQATGFDIKNCKAILRKGKQILTRMQPNKVGCLYCEKINKHQLLPFRTLELRHKIGLGYTS
jgi:hypothetical protein